MPLDGIWAASALLAKCSPDGVAAAATEGWMAEVVAPRSRRTESVPRPATSLPRSLMSRFSTGHLVMIVAGLLGLLLTVAVAPPAAERQPVPGAARHPAPRPPRRQAS